MPYNPGQGYLPPSRSWMPGHPGIDFPAPAGTEIRAALPGTVWYSGYNSLYGNMVILRHEAADGTVFYTLYAHMNGENMPALDAPISAGDPIGEVGNTGRSDGNHLHYEVLWPPAGIEPTHGAGGPMGFEPFWYRYNPELPFPGDPGSSLADWWKEISNFVSNFFTSAQRFVPRRDPLVLDLDGDGIETTAVAATNPVMFDHDGDGVKTGTGWVKADDGFLVLDRNGNGVIDNGRELFGDSTLLSGGGTAADGFAALQDQDTNADGKISNLDA